MRTIKFRAWNKKLQGMYTTFALTQDGKMLGANGLGAWQELKSNDDNYVLMQFTGLTDKNGKEIYEGDIVNILNEEIVNTYFQSSKIKVRFEEGIFWPFQMVHGESVEVIGNIYENPDKMKMHKTLEERDRSSLEGEHSPDYEEVERLQKTGRTGTESWIARAKYQSRKIREYLGL